jgi:hypothetical protein
MDDVFQAVNSGKDVNDLQPRNILVKDCNFDVSQIDILGKDFNDSHSENIESI